MVASNLILQNVYLLQKFFCVSYVLQPVYLQTKALGHERSFVVVCRIHAY